MLKDSIHSKLILLESAIFQGRRDGRIDSIKDAYGELQLHLEKSWVHRVKVWLFRKRWNLK